MPRKAKEKNMKKMIIFMTVVLVSGMVSAGDLNPPAAPSAGGTMKTLEEVEPRIPIPASAKPGAVYVINQRGSYYLAGDRYCSGTGIEVNVDNVTIDLMGYSLIGPDSGTNYGLYANGRENIEIRNGTIRDFRHGIYNDASQAFHYRIINVQVSSNILNGIYLRGRDHLIKNCMVNDNGGSSSTEMFGVCVSTACMLIENSISSNGISATAPVYGLQSGSGCTIVHNTVYENGYGASDIVYGIDAGGGNNVSDNTVYLNGYTATATAEVCGIYASNGSTISGNTLRGNGYQAGTVYGIQCGSGCRVKDNTVYSNGNSATGDVYGIYTVYGHTIVGNDVYYNGNSAGGAVTGIRLYSSSLVDQNTVYNNGQSASSAINMDLTIASCVYGNNVAP